MSRGNGGTVSSQVSTSWTGSGIFLVEEKSGKEEKNQPGNSIKESEENPEKTKDPEPEDMPFFRSPIPHSAVEENPGKPQDPPE